MSNIVRFDAVRSIALASITNVYQPLGSAFSHAMRVLNFKNNTNGDMMVSFDGVTDNLPVFASSFDLYDLTSNQDSTERFRYQNGTQLYVKYVTAPTLPVDGTFAVVAIYGKGE